MLFKESTLYSVDSGEHQISFEQKIRWLDLSFLNDHQEAISMPNFVYLNIQIPTLEVGLYLRMGSELFLLESQSWEVVLCLRVVQERTPHMLD